MASILIETDIDEDDLKKQIIRECANRILQDPRIVNATRDYVKMQTNRDATPGLFSPNPLTDGQDSAAIMRAMQVQREQREERARVTDSIDQHDIAKEIARELDLMIGARIKHLRVINGWGQAHLAAMLSVTAKAISRWENGKSINLLANPETLSKLSSAFGRTPQYMLCGFITETAPDHTQKETNNGNRETNRAT